MKYNGYQQARKWAFKTIRTPAISGYIGI